jgi:hypothetical protein
MANQKLNTLIEGKYYTISFEFNDIYSSKELNIIEIQVLIKLENSIKIKLIQKNETKWYPSTKYIQLFDEIPVKYFRKEKLKKLEDIEE